MTIAFKPTASSTTIEQNGSAIATLDSNGLTMAAGKTIVGSGVGKILQVVSITKTDTFSTTSSYADVTGLSVTITPSSTSSKILVHYDVFGSNSGTELVGVRILRVGAANPLYVGDTAGSRKVGAKFHRDNSGAYGGNMNGTFLDSPSSTSAETYKVQIGVGTASTAYVNRVATDTDNVNFPRGVSSITVMEIAG